MLPIPVEVAEEPFDENKRNYAVLADLEQLVRLFFCLYASFSHLRYLICVEYRSAAQTF